jgi:cyclohexanecarboxylate-CoA ligase
VIGVNRLYVLGTTTILMDTWNAEDAARLVAEHGVTSTAGPPFYLNGLLDAGETLGLDLSSIRGYTTGAASVPPALVERSEAAGIPSLRSYGSTEHPTITATPPEGPLEKRAFTDGELIGGNELRIVDDDGKDLPVGAAGEIASRGPECFVGYRNPALDAVSFLPGAWFLTGDIGVMDEDGFLTITDRKKDVIIRGGENISSKEVEDVLARHPSCVP